MMGAAGILVEDLLGHLGAGGPAAQTPWCAALGCAVPVASCAMEWKVLSARAFRRTQAC
jgi:hypothetical protein